MEPVTHMLTGACLARAGCNRKAAYATAVMVVAAEFPDIDTLWGLRGPVEGFAHHRGITHTFVGVPVEAALLVAAAYGVHRWRVRRAGASKRALTKAPVDWAALYGFALLALLSHLLLDYTNNYGLRPFFPFNDHWYAASIVFIFDPAIFVLLVAGLVLPALFGLINAEVGARRAVFRGRGLATAALVGVACLWTLLEVEHGLAVHLAMQQSYAQTVQPTSTDSVPEAAGGVAPPEPAPVYLPAQRALASPDPLNPFRWAVVTDFGAVYQLSEVDNRYGTLTPEEPTYPKPDGSPEVRAAEASPLGRAYLDWSPMPIVMEDVPVTGESPDSVGQPLPPGERTVTFRDPRFMGGTDWLHLGGRAPLTGVVTLNAQRAVVAQQLDGRTEP